MTDEKTEAAAAKVARERSPSFPFIPLGTAIERLEEFDRTFGRQDTPADRVYLAWGMKGDTSQSQQTLAALKAFGLVDYKGSGPKRPIGISSDGRTYLRAQQDTVKREVLKRVAVKPKWIAHFWEIWGSDRVPDPIRLDALVLHHKFNENGAPNFLKVYDETIAFAGLADSDKSTPASDPEEGPPAAKLGDFVQWASGGINQFSAPRQVIGVSDDGLWLWVEGSQTGIAMSEVEIVEVPKIGGPPAIPPSLIAATAAAAKAAGIDPGPAPSEREEKFDTDEGVVLIRFPEELSAASVEELEAFLQLFIKKAKRRAGVQ